MDPSSPYSNKSYHQMRGNEPPPSGAASGPGGDRIDVRVRPDKSNRGAITVRVKGVVDDVDQDDMGGPWGARGPMWFLLRLLVLVMSIVIIATRGWAIGGPRYVSIIMKIDNTNGQPCPYPRADDCLQKVSDRAFIEWSEIGIVSACYKAWASSAIRGPLDGVECDGVWEKWDEAPWLVALIFSVFFVVTLGFRLTLEAAELFNPGCLPVAFQNPAFLCCMRHWTWICMLITWACFLGHWNNDKFDPLDIEYTEITELHWGFWTWVGMWILWMFKVICITIGRI